MWWLRYLYPNMRKLRVVAALLALLVVPVALAVQSAQKDGTLSIKDGDGMVYINGRGAVIGQIDKVQKIVLVDVREEDGTPFTLTGCDSGSLKEQSTVDGEGLHTTCKSTKGAKIKFKLIGGLFRMRIIGGRGIDMSVVGRTAPDRVELDGTGGDDPEISDDGTYSFDGEPYKSLPNKKQTFQLGS